MESQGSRSSVGVKGMAVGDKKRVPGTYYKTCYIFTGNSVCPREGWKGAQCAHLHFNGKINMDQTRGLLN